MVPKAPRCELGQHKADRKIYINLARQRIAELEELSKVDAEESDLDRGAGWDIESLREEVRQGAFPGVKGL